MKTLWILPVSILLIAVIGYALNIVKIFSYDFKAPYKAEIIRIGSAFIAPVGVVVGYIDVKDN